MSSCLHFTWLSPCLHFHEAPVIYTEYRLVVHQSAHELVIRDSKQGVRSKEDREGEREREWRTVRHGVTSQYHLFSFIGQANAHSVKRRKREERKKGDLLLSEGDGRQRVGAPACLCEPDWAVTASTDTDGEKETEREKEKESGEKRRWRGRLEAWLRALALLCSVHCGSAGVCVCVLVLYFVFREIPWMRSVQIHLTNLLLNLLFPQLSACISTASMQVHICAHKHKHTHTHTHRAFPSCRITQLECLAPLR